MSIDKINLEEELNKLKESIDTVTNDWFYKQQTVLGITDGDLGFELTIAYENTLDTFVDICKQGLEFQYACAKRSFETKTL